MRELPSYLRVLDGGGEGESGSASSPFGPLKVGLIQSQTTQDQALSELLNDLERRIDELRFKFFTVLDTFNIDIKPRVEAGTFFPSTDGIKE